MPTSAAARAGASLMPSPTITTGPRPGAACIARTIVDLALGGQVARRRRRPRARRPISSPRRPRVAAEDRHVRDAGRAQPRDRLGGVVAHGVGQVRMPATRPSSPPARGCGRRRDARRGLASGAARAGASQRALPAVTTPAVDAPLHAHPGALDHALRRRQRQARARARPPRSPGPPRWPTSAPPTPTRRSSSSVGMRRPAVTPSMDRRAGREGAGLVEQHGARAAQAARWRPSPWRRSRAARGAREARDERDRGREDERAGRRHHEHGERAHRVAAQPPRRADGEDER